MAQRSQDGQPLGGAWAQVVVDTGSQLLALDAAPQVFAQEVDLAQLAGGDGLGMAVGFGQGALVIQGHLRSC